MESQELQVTPDELYSQIGALTIENKKLYQHIKVLEDKIQSFQDAVVKNEENLKEAKTIDALKEAEVVDPSQNGTLPKQKGRSHARSSK